MHAWIEWRARWSIDTVSTAASECSQRKQLSLVRFGKKFDLQHHDFFPEWLLIAHLHIHFTNSFTQPLIIAISSTAKELNLLHAKSMETTTVVIDRVCVSVCMCVCVLACYCDVRAVWMQWECGAIFDVVCAAVVQAFAENCTRTWSGVCVWEREREREIVHPTEPRTHTSICRHSHRRDVNEWMYVWVWMCVNEWCLSMVNQTYVKHGQSQSLPTGDDIRDESAD